MKWVLSHLTDEVLCASIIEDLEYRFQQDRNIKWSFFRFIRFVFQSVITCFPLLIDKGFGGLAMFKNYIKITFRTIKKQKVYSFINIFGLAIGVGICIVIFLFMEYELGFDSHFHHKENICRVVTHINSPEGMEYEGCTPFPTAAALRNDFSELELATPVYRVSDAMISIDTDRFKETSLLFVNPQFFKFEGTEWILGEPEKSLDDPHSVILTERLALKYFGETEVMGRTLRLDNEFDLHVTGVVTNPPRRTSLPYDMLISWNLLNDYHGARSSLDDKWNFIDGDCLTFIRLPASVDPKYLEERFDAFEKKYMEPLYAEKWSFRLQPLKDIHFNPRYGSYNYVTSRITLFSFAAIGFLILLIACFNFINLTTAQAMKRAREMGMRKVLGAARVQLIRQLLGETSLFTFLAILTAIFLAWGFLPQLNQFLGNNTELRFVPSIGILVFLCSIYFFVSFLNGLYPSFVLSRYRPADALKQKIFSRGKSTYRLRNGLVLIQFIVSQILIVGMLVIAGQMKHLSRMDLGFRKEGMVTVRLPEYEEASCEALRSEWLKNPHIKNISFAWSAPTSRSNFDTPFVYESSGNLVRWQVCVKMCDKRYLDVYEIPLIAGKFFERNAGDESHKQWVVNEEVVRRMGFPDPWEAVGKRVNVNGLDGEIIGVIRDFHVYSLRSEIKPIVFFNFWPGNHNEAQIRMDMVEVRHTMDYIQNVWAAYYPDYLFERAFLDDFLKGLYESESKMLIMIQTASFLAILIGCLGLLGLVSFMVLQRTKEIGIRKVLGATVGSIYVIVSKEFLKWVVIASITAWPVAYLLSSKWLQEFAYRIRLNVGYFIAGGLISLGIALIVLSYQVIRAATANPVDSLRYE